LSPRPSDAWTLQNGEAEEQVHRLPFLNLMTGRIGWIQELLCRQSWSNCYESISFRQAGFSGSIRKRILKNSLDTFLSGASISLGGQPVDNLVYLYEIPMKILSNSLRISGLDRAFLAAFAAPAGKGIPVP
jgi:hypothetical protein